jgi:hypothetical protein
MDMSVGVLSDAELAQVAGSGTCTVGTDGASCTVEVTTQDLLDIIDYLEDENVLQVAWDYYFGD